MEICCSMIFEEVLYSWVADWERTGEIKAAEGEKPWHLVPSWNQTQKTQDPTLPMMHQDSLILDSPHLLNFYIHTSSL